MGRPRKPRASTASKTKQLPPDFQDQPRQTIYAQKSPEILAVEAEIQDLKPADILYRTSRGLPSTVTYPTIKRNEDGSHDLVFITEIVWPTFDQQMAAADKCAGYKSPKLQAHAIQEVKQRVVNVIEVPAISVDDWEAQAIESQSNLQKKVDDLIGE